MFVSASAATIVQLVSAPTALGGWRELSPLRSLLRALRRFIKQPQPLLHRQLGANGIRRHDANSIARRHQLDFISHANAERIDESFGKRNLKFSSHPRHDGSIYSAPDCVKEFSLILAVEKHHFADRLRTDAIGQQQPTVAWLKTPPRTDY
jgi:hypothetical protein